jgi:hypothetical protein
VTTEVTIQALTCRRELDGKAESEPDLTAIRLRDTARRGCPQLPERFVTALASSIDITSVLPMPSIDVGSIEVVSRPR